MGEKPRHGVVYTQLSEYNLWGLLLFLLPCESQGLNSDCQLSSWYLSLLSLLPCPMYLFNIRLSHEYFNRECFYK